MFYFAPKLAGGNIVCSQLQTILPKSAADNSVPASTKVGCKQYCLPTFSAGHHAGKGSVAPGDSERV